MNDLDISQKLHLKDLWEVTSANIGMRKDNSEHVFQLITSMYSDPRRTFHNLSHIYYCLVKSQKLCSLHGYSFQETVNLAIWFHDIQYTGSVGYDERMSAEILSSLKPITLTNLSKSAKLILLTERHEESKELVENFFLDIDMSILASDPDTYQQYSESIIQEYKNLYSLIPPTMIEQGRLKFLKELLTRDKIFHHYKRWEADARSNIENEIKQLSESK